MRIADALNSPGKGTGTGDDRYGFDEAAKTIWVIDGSTDVGQVRLFPDYESDAAWLAEAMSTRLVTPPPPHQALRDYFADVTRDLGKRAAAACAMSLANAPRDSWPTAAFVWARVRDGQIDVARLADCVALLGGLDGSVQVFGDADQQDAETTKAAEFSGASWEEMLPYLRRQRAAVNTPGLYLDPLAGEPIMPARLNIQTAPLPEKPVLVVMSDGLYRLVSPFGLYDDAGLFDLVVKSGLDEALNQLREAERAADGPARFKSSDDATGVVALLG